MHIQRVGLSLGLLFFLTVGQIAFASVPENNPLEAVFQRHAVEGTIVISNLEGDQNFVRNHVRADEPLNPASTFKILNLLFALKMGVTNPEEVFKWDGEKRGIVSWNQDQTLIQAFQNSCLPVFQELARRIGLQAYREQLQKISYGNVDPGDNLTGFWLKDGALKISPHQQVAFLKSVYKQELDFTPAHYAVLKEAMDINKDGSLYYKTGTATKDWKGHGWYVGYVMVEDQPWFFATNILVDKREDMSLREEVTMDCLRALGILGSES